MKFVAAHAVALVFSCAGALVCFACTTTTAEGAPSSGGASASQVSECKSSCDKMKFFECNSADEQARCYADCNTATPDQIQLFNGCAQNSICDPECRTRITPAPTAASSGGSTTTTMSGGGATASTCASACDKIITQCSFAPVGEKADCESECEKSGYQYQIDCVNKTSCDKIKATCGDPTGGGTVVVTPRDDGGTTTTSGGLPDFKVMECQDACDSIHFFMCITADEQSTCRSTCSSATADKRDTFTSCAHTASGDCTNGDAKDCYNTFTK